MTRKFNLNMNELLAAFPLGEPRPSQREALEAIAASDRGALIEMPTGEGKTAVGLCALRAMASKTEGPLYYVTPTKIQADQVHRLHPETLIMYGRSEYPCLYYESRGQSGVTAQESPCYMLKCGHRVNQETGATEEAGVEPCPYFRAKFEAREAGKSGRIVVTTTAFFLVNRLMVSGWKDETAALVVLDEVHRTAKTARGIFEYHLTEYHLRRAVRLLREIDRDAATRLGRFCAGFIRISRRRPSQRPALLSESEIGTLLGYLEGIDADNLEKSIREAMEEGGLDPMRDREELKLLETLTRNIPRLVRSLQYALEDEERSALNFVVAFYYQTDDPEFADSERVAQYHLHIRSYFVLPLIRAAVGDRVVAYSATIGEPRIVGFETGLRMPFTSIRSSFSNDNTRIYLPIDTPNLAAKVRRRDDVKKSLRRIAECAKNFSERGYRSLVVVVSEEERSDFRKYSEEIELDLMSYGNGLTAREVATRFARGAGQVLVGTVAHYGEGVDLPGGVAPVIFFLRPSYPPPDDPEAQFEIRRFSEGQRWALWNWRVMIEALQVRGRNIRSASDIGVCFFISQQFKRFLYGSLPEWLRPAYRSNLTMGNAVEDALKLLA